MKQKIILKTLPKFKTEDEERDFWATHDSTEYLDWSQAEPVLFPNLKRTSEAISFRLSSSLLARIKVVARKNNVPYQSLMKVWLSERMGQELKANL